MRRSSAPEDGRALTEVIIKLADDPRLRRELARKARAYAEASFDGDVIVRKIFGSLQSAIWRS
jgi:hypothetical protein